MLDSFSEGCKVQRNKKYLNEWELQYLRVERLSVIMLSALDKFKFVDQCTIN